MKYFIILLLLNIPALLCGQISHAKGMHYIDAQVGFIPVENFGYTGRIGYGAYVNRSFSFAAHLEYENFGYSFLDEDYFVYERTVSPDGTEFLDSVASPRDRPGNYRQWFISGQTEYTLVSGYDAFFVHLLVGGRIGMEQGNTLKPSSSLELSYGGFTGGVVELLFSDQWALMGEIRYSYLLKSRFEHRLTLSGGIRYSFRP